MPAEQQALNSKLLLLLLLLPLLLLLLLLLPLKVYNLIDLSEKSNLSSCYFLLLLVPVPRAMGSL